MNALQRLSPRARMALAGVLAVGIYLFVRRGGGGGGAGTVPTDGLIPPGTQTADTGATGGTTSGGMSSSDLQNILDQNSQTTAALFTSLPRKSWRFAAGYSRP